MQTWIGVMGLLAMLGIGAPAQEQQKGAVNGATCELKVEGMSCGACAARFEREARKIEGVTAAKVDHPSAKAQITYNPEKTSPSVIAKTVTERSGFEATVIAPKAQ
jgi:copper chaperone CopZ